MIEDFVTTFDAVEILNLSRIKLSQRRVAGLCAEGKIIGAKKMGKTWLIPKEALEIYIVSHPRRNKKSVKAETQQAAESMSDAERVILDAGSDNV